MTNEERLERLQKRIHLPPGGMEALAEGYYQLVFQVEDLQVENESLQRQLRDLLAWADKSHELLHRICEHHQSEDKKAVLSSRHTVRTAAIAYVKARGTDNELSAWEDLLSATVREVQTEKKAWVMQGRL